MSDYEYFIAWLVRTYPAYAYVYASDNVIQSAFFAGLSVQAQRNKAQLCDFDIKKQVECVGSMAFKKSSGVRVPLHDYMGSDEIIVKIKVLEAARKKGCKGTVADRMTELGWWIEPVYVLKHDME